MKKVKVGKSKIHGNGLFADEPIKRGDVIELVHTMRELEPGVMKTTPTLLGRNYNHSEDSNALNVVDGNNRYLVALKEIEAGGEITTDYRTNPELEQPGSFASNDNYISFDYDDTLTTPEGFKLAQQMNKEGKNLYVITARDKVTPQMIERAEAAGIPKENIITAGSDEAKVRIIKENNISKHIDNKESVIKALGDTGELFTPDAYPDLKADFIEMDLTTDDLNKLKEGGFIVEESPDKGIITQEEIDAANNAMMKARLAYAYMHGNPAAQRMVVAPDQPYDFGDGMTGTHYMASIDNYAVPQIQDVNGQLMLGDYGPESAEAIRFDSDEGANYFAENYKQVTPDPSYRQEEYAKGGDPGKGKKGKSKNVQPFVTSDPEEYAYRKAAYDDSLNLYNLNKNFRDAAKKFFFTDYDHLTKPTTKNTKAALDEWKKLIKTSEKWDAYKRISKVPNKPSGAFANYGAGYTQAAGDININAPGTKVLKKKGDIVLIKNTNPGYQKPVQPVQFKKEQPPIVEKEVIEPTPVPQPVPTPVMVNPELQKFVEERKPEPPRPGTDVMPVYDTDELPMYATPDNGAEWVGDTERYVDWDGNRIPYRLPRFRKPGHGGDLIRQGKKRYIPFPSIESRYQAEIVPEEEYKKGGEPKKRKKDSKGRYRSEDGNIRTPLTPEMQAVMPPEEWGQYVQEVPEVYTTRTREQQDIKNALDYQQRIAELYPGMGMPTQSDAIQPADWFWQLGMLGPAALKGANAAMKIPLGAGVNVGGVLNTAMLAHGATEVDDRYQDWQDVVEGNMDWKEAALKTGMTALELSPAYGAAKKLLPQTHKINPFAGKLGTYNRVVGHDAIDDIRKSGLVRVNEDAGVANDLGPFGIVNRTTPYPSFGPAGAPPSKTYALQVIDQGQKPYIISTSRPMKVSNLGRHGKGSTQFPMDETGKYMSGFPASEAKVFEYADKPHWFWGYKKVPRELPGSPNGTFAYRNVTPSRVRSTNTGLTNADIDKEVANNIKWITSPEYARRRAANTGESLEEIQKSVDNIIKDADKAKFNLNSNPWIADLYERSGVMKSKTWLRPAKVEVSASAEQPIQTLNHEIKHLYSPSIYNQNKLYDNYPTLGDAADDYLGIGAEQQVRHLNAREQILAENNLPIDAKLSEEQVREFVDGWGSRMNKMNKTNDFSLKEDFDAIWNDEAAKIQKEMLMARYNTDDLSFISKLPTSQKVKFISEYRDRLTRSITDALNKAWVTVPIAGGAGLNSLETSEQRYGGSISKLNKFIR